MQKYNKNNKIIKLQSGFLKARSGATAIAFGLSFMVIIALTGLAVDTARHYAVRSQLQAAVDTGLLGAMKTIREIPDVESEFTRLFFANYPRANNGYDAWYLGTTINEIQVTSDVQAVDDGTDAPQQVPSHRNTRGEYTATVTVRSPNTFMQIFGRDYETVSASASAVNNERQVQKKAEISFILDTTGSMCLVNGQPDCTALNSLKLAMTEAINVLFAGLETVEHIYINIIPYSTAVTFDTTRIPNVVNWIQPAWQERVNWQLWAGPQLSNPNRVYLSNRNPDMPANAAYSDTTDALPTTDFTKFRTPIAKSGAINSSLPQYPTVPYVNGFGQYIGAYIQYWCYDEETFGQQPAVFHMQEKTPLLNMINGLQAVGCTRIPTGAMWGMLALSPTWRGMLNSAQPNVPLPNNPNNLKYMVLMTDGENTVFSGQIPFPPQTQATSDDDVTTRAICTAAKGRGVRIFTIGLGASIDQQLLIDCATDPADYFHAPTPGALRPIFENLATIIVEEVDPLRLTR